MPYRPQKPCGWADCPRLTHARYCAPHALLARQMTPARPTAARRGYGSDWQRIRAQVIAEQPICPCGARAQDVHHRIPIRNGGTHARGNLIALCRSCHARITAEQRAR